MPSERRRRKKLRVEADTSSSESSDSESGVEDEVSHDHQRKNASDPSDLSESESDSNPSGDVHMHDEEELSRTEVETVESSRRLLSQPTDGPESYQEFLALCTTQFGDDLEKLRESNFGPGALEQLVAGLKEGINIFSPEQRKLWLASQAGQ